MIIADRKSATRSSFILIVLLATAVTIVVAGSAVAQPRNLALHRPYECTPAPNYAPTRDEGDRTDLTDGNRAAERKEISFWEDKSIVGWSRPREPIVITLDLGQVQPIGGAALHTGFGSAGVSVARSIALLVSDDGSQFQLVGDLIRLNKNLMPPAYGTYTRYTYQTDSLQTRGRFVRFVVIPSGRFFFSDEIEVFAGNPAIGSIQKEPLVEMSQLIEPQRLTQLGAYARIRTDLETVQAMIGGIGPADSLHAEAASLNAELAATNELVKYNEEFRAIVPLNDLHRRVFALFGRVLAATGAAPLTIWHSPPYQIVDLFARPGTPVPQLSLDLMLNERRAQVFNITNASAEAKPVNFDINGLPGGINPDYVHVYEVQAVDTREGKVCASALLPLKAVDGHYHTEAPAGMTRQIWLAFEPRNIQPGQHAGRLRINAREFSHEVQIALSVAPIRFPDHTRLAFSGFDEIMGKGYSITEQNQQAARQFVLDDPLINGVWCTPKNTPIPSASAFDAQGNLVGAIDFSHWDAFVAFWPNQREYLAFANFNADTLFAGTKIGTLEFDRAMSQWAAAWADHNRKLGLEPGQVVVLFVDEPADEKTLAASYYFGRAFGQGTSDIRTFTDPNIRSIASEWGRKNKEAYDIICPHLPDFIDQNDQTQSQCTAGIGHGQELWFYSCSGPARMFDPSYYRLQPWHAYLHGGTGSLFWAFGDASGSTSWNEYAGGQFRESFTPLYIGYKTINTSKHFEAAREGVMDYEYLCMLKDRIAQLSDSPGHAAAVERAKRLLQSLPESLINDVESRFNRREYLRWQNASALAEEARGQVLKMLVELDHN